MSESQFNLRVKNAAKATPAGEDENEYTACSFGRVGIRPQVSVTFRTVRGAGFNVAYSHYYGMTDQNPNGGFVVEFSRHRVTVEGRNLERLVLLIGDQKCREIREADELHAAELPESEPVVTRLVIEAKGPNEEL